MNSLATAARELIASLDAWIKCQAAKVTPIVNELPTPQRWLIAAGITALLVILLLICIG